MTPREYLDELAYPARSSETLIALVTFVLLLSLAAVSRLAGIWLAIVVVPAVLRYMTLIAGSRAKGENGSPPEITDFSLVGNLWTLFPTVIFVVAGYCVHAVGTNYGDTAGYVAAITAATIVPAMIIVLVITHSPLQSINPTAVWTAIRETGDGYVYLPFTAMLVVLVPTLLGDLPRILQLLIELYLLFAFFAVLGASTRKNELMEQVYIEAEEEAPEKQVANLLRERTGVLNHTYGLMSRGNRTGGLQHIDKWLARDPDPEAAWSWFLEQMLRWENSDHALFYAQVYIARLLASGERVQAVKVILRGRHVNDNFKPRTEDMPAAIQAAESTGNTELAAVLRRL